MTPLKLRIAAAEIDLSDNLRYTFDVVGENGGIIAVAFGAFLASLGITFAGMRLDRKAKAIEDPWPNP